MFLPDSGRQRRTAIRDAPQPMFAAAAEGGSVVPAEQSVWHGGNLPARGDPRGEAFRYQHEGESASCPSPGLTVLMGDPSGFQPECCR